MSTIARIVGVNGILLLGLCGCKDLSGTQPLPAGTGSAAVLQNTVGALQTAVAAQVVVQQAFAEYVPVSGALTDELQAYGRASVYNSAGNPNITIYPVVVVDARQLDQSADWYPPSQISIGATSDTVYGRLQQARALVYQAIGSLTAYAPDSVALRGKMYALLGYTEIMLADLFCSGVPLSTLDFQGDFTYQAGSTTTQIYTHAIAAFDTALSLASNDSQTLNLSRVGQGRAYLALGNYSSAGQVVSEVSPTFQWSDSIITCGNNNTACVTGQDGQFNSARFALYSNTSTGYSVSDREGGGLPFVSSGDPRTADTVLGTSQIGNYSDYFPKKYAVQGISVLVMASGLEGQLITAEADLNVGNVAGMFAILNDLRKSNPITVGMPTLTDPGTFGAEVDTLFTERAAWLFVDGHRQGDLRRLMRNYVEGQGVHVIANQYPSGDYGFGVGLYGGFIDAPVPALERVNPHFTGCLSRD